MAGPGTAPDERVMVAVSASSSVAMDAAEISEPPWDREASWNASSAAFRTIREVGVLTRTSISTWPSKVKFCRSGVRERRYLSGMTVFGSCRAGAGFHVGSLMGDVWWGVGLSTAPKRLI